jgi:diguanylate cyclase (GGDEF)-like protein
MYQKENEQLKEEIARLNAEIGRLSIDAVTGVAGRGVLDRAMVTGFARAKRTAHSMGILMIDIDHFKSVNDDFGHQVGDALLRIVAETLGACTRGVDTLARYGGEEFVVLVDFANDTGLAILAENMRKAVDSLNLSGYPLVTISVGWSLQITWDETATDILKRADAAMYVAKANGRNRVERG